MFRIVVIVVVLTLVLPVAGGVGYVARLRSAFEARLGPDYQPPAAFRSSAFTDALWAHLERSSPVALDRDVSLLALFGAAVSKSARQAHGFLLASVAAHTLEPGRRDAVREIIHAHVLLQRYDADTLTAIYASTAPFSRRLVGLDAAATQLYGKPAALLDPVEAATLVILSWTPNRCDPNRLRDRRNALVRTMQSLGLAPPGPPPDELGTPALVQGSFCPVAGQLDAG